MLLIACGTPAPRAPSAVVRADVDRAETAEKSRQHETARLAYERAIADAKTPEDIAFARHEYAETLIAWGELKLAVAQLEAALAARPEDAPTWHDLGMLRQHEGDITGALVAFEKARALLPDDPRPRIALAALRWRSGDVAGATAEYKELLALDLPDRLRAKVQWALAELAKPGSIRNTPGE